MEVNIKSTLNTVKADIDKTLQQIRAEVADGGVGGLRPTYWHKPINGPLWGLGESMYPSPISVNACFGSPVKKVN